MLVHMCWRGIDSGQRVEVVHMRETIVDWVPKYCLDRCACHLYRRPWRSQRGLCDHQILRSQQIPRTPTLFNIVNLLCLIHPSDSSLCVLRQRKPYEAESFASTSIAILDDDLRIAQFINIKTYVLLTASSILPNDSKPRRNASSSVCHARPLPGLVPDYNIGGYRLTQ